MSLSARSVLIVFAALFAIALGHSQMRCAKYNKATGKCSAPIRNQGYAFMQESHPYSAGQPICQSEWTNPISASYANGAGCPDWAPCPDAMGNYYPGEQFTVMWYARNHAISNQNPDTIRVYISPKESANAGADVSAATMASTQICQGPYMNCGGVNQDTTPCTLECTMPSNVASGVYTLWWKWDWQGAIFTTCADINVSGSGTPTPTIPTAPATTGKVSSITSGRVVSTPLTTGKVVSTPPASSLTTSKVRVATTGSSRPVTTGATVPSTPSTSSSSTSCTLGHQRCSSSNTFQTCGWASNTITGWSANQNCPNGLSCKSHPVSPDYIWCY